MRDQGTHEGRQVAFELIEKRPDARRLLKTREVLRLGEGNDNWASVDAFCRREVGNKLATGKKNPNR